MTFRGAISQIWQPEGIPASAGAIILDPDGRLLILKPNYKDGWTIPGGVMEADGESPWDACRREVLEETRLKVRVGRLVCVDTRPAKPKKGRQLGLRFLFHCGNITAEQAGSVKVQKYEISKYRFAEPAEALRLLRPAVSRRVAVGLDAKHCSYLENGRLLDDVR